MRNEEVVVSVVRRGVLFNVGKLHKLEEGWWDEHLDQHCDIETLISIIVRMVL